MNLLNKLHPWQKQSGTELKDLGLTLTLPLWRTWD